MDQQEIVADFERRAQALSLPISTVCERADIHRTSFSRWKVSRDNPKPVGMTLASMNAIEAALLAFEQGRAA